MSSSNINKNEEETKQPGDKEAMMVQQHAEDAEQPTDPEPAPPTRALSKQSSLLPVVTDEIMADYVEELRRKTEHPDGEDTPEICGIPYYLMAILLALGVAVITGTVLAVIYYDPNGGVQPPEYPTQCPSSVDDAAGINNSTGV